MSDLSKQQLRFVEEYLKDLNGAQAAIRAGYSAKSAKVAASRLLTNDNVQEGIKTQIEARSKRTGIDADWLLLRLAEEAQADMADLYDDSGNLRPVKEWPLIWRQGLVAGVDVVRRQGDDPAVIDKVKISDRIKRLELIGRHIDVQAFRDTVVVEHVDRASEIEAFFHRKSADATRSTH